MTNIWEFLLQTAEVSAVAVMILTVKWLFTDKLSPRWQYSVWILLAIKIFLPAGFMGRFFSVNLASTLEAGKAVAEAGLSSTYSGQWMPIGQAASVIPQISTAPSSVTDWIFIVYVAGVLISLLRYGLSYIRLRLILRRGRPVEGPLQETMKDLCQQYGLSPCEMVSIEGIPSVFICGIFTPILVVPASESLHGNLDEKILVHELFHRTYGDALQNVFWCLARALHWCNPFLQYVFNRIGNDMESLCDQRVLEELSGEERREYGRILLSMTDEKYARAPGTTSISNGGKNIKGRIEAIARFKKYPRGMALVSVCVFVALAAPVFAGTEATEYDQGYANLDYYNSQMNMAKARLNRCTTPAGAIDTWVKGMVFEQTAFLAAVTPYEMQGELEDQIKHNKPFSYEISKALKGAQFSDYAVYNLKKEGENCYTALAVLEGSQDYEAEIYDEEGVPQQGMKPVLAIPLTLKEENGWTVVQSGEIQEYEISSGLSIRWANKDMPGIRISEGEGRTGTVIIKEQSIGVVDNQGEHQGDFFADMMGKGFSFDGSAKRSARFSEEKTCVWGEYQDSRASNQRKGIELFGMMVTVLEHMSDAPEDIAREYLNEEVSGSSTDGQGYDFSYVKQPWDGKFGGLNFVLWNSNDNDYTDFAGFDVRIYQDGRLLDTLKIKRGAKL